MWQADTCFKKRLASNEFYSVDEKCRSKIENCHWKKVCPFTLNVALNRHGIPELFCT